MISLIRACAMLARMGDTMRKQKENTERIENN